MTRPGAPSARGRHSAPEEGPGRHAAPEEAPPVAPVGAPLPSGRRRHAAPDFSGGYGDGPSRRRHAADEDDAAEGSAGLPDYGYHAEALNGYHAEPEPPVNGYRADPVNGFGADPVNGFGADPVNGFGADPVNGYRVEPVNGFRADPVNGYRADPVNRYQADPFNGFGVEPVDGFGGEPGSSFDGYLDEPGRPVNGYHGVEPVAGFPYTAPSLDARTAWPVNGHGLDAAERDAAEWPVNGHAAIPPVNGHGAIAPNGHAGPLNGTAHPPEPPVDGVSAWPRHGHPAPVDKWDAPPVDGPAGVNGHPAADPSGPAPLAGWQRQPFRPSYRTSLRQDTAATVLPPAPAVLPPAAEPATALRPAAEPATADPPAPRADQPWPAGPWTGAATVGPATVGPATAVPPAAGTDSVGAPAPARLAPEAPTSTPAAFPLDADDESTQLLRRYVPAAETLGREKSERPPGRPAKPLHPPRAVVRRRQARRRRLEWPFLIVFALLSAYLIRAYVVQTFYIPSASMHETLVEGDRVLVNKISYRMHDVHRGDVIVFAKPPKLVADEDDLIKRVVALPGETVEGRGGKVYINGAPLTEPYVAPSCTVNTTDFAPLTVPAGDLWVMGDNRCNSADSRVFGVIDEHTVVGRAFVLVWPVGRFAGL